MKSKAGRGVSTSNPRGISSKLVTAAELRRRMAQARKRNRNTRWVFTNGCFDILHKGHVRYLEQARRLGDHLIVALNTDASVRALKGPDRPINSLRDRMEVIAALECVDFVVSFGDETPLRLIRALTPDVLVKGGDWKPEQIVGSDWVLEHGGSVRSLRFVEGRSTTRIIQKARSSAAN